MRAFVATAGIVFALLVVAHLWRVAVEGSGVLTGLFVAITVAAAALALWAWRVWRAMAPPR